VWFTFRNLRVFLIFEEKSEKKSGIFFFEKMVEEKREMCFLRFQFLRHSS